ncbi:hydroxyacylglutathione hydrolase [Vespertiliibacter pulmonis]|uniref:Hydroxyacylglutathione hydrolase n=1 Tax=Vespertiliibacter pulmonis TaxID=1443036 RepID=A0A3N4VXX0_9PAST|nr:hydroxyacylglutathione hydrolase [Vespertiliibacter pulmonis]QLB20217.1 hydroxyacylglutathione hydrolase [Vespertiliibacter pulmonis]RPE86193.1 hydroxyacylglutathione hydrolase [Vespertiliibacter pulmonis]
MIKITPISALADNYIWLLQQGTKAIIFDPSESEPVLDFITKNQLELTACLLTHNHSDHTNGVEGLRAKFPELTVIGPQETAVFNTQCVEPKQQFYLLDLRFEVIKSAGHTAGHISYLVDNQWLFCGDSLFSGGCGRVFTGDYQAQYEALQQFKQLPDEIQVFPAHEYTQSNLKFAATVILDQPILLAYQARVDLLREQGKVTLPTTIGLEKQVNPFIQAGSLSEFITLRQQKDIF